MVLRAVRCLKGSFKSTQMVRTGDWCVAIENKQIDRNCSNETRFSKQVQNMRIVDYKVDGIFEPDSVPDQKPNDLWHQCKSRQ